MWKKPLQKGTRLTYVAKEYNVRQATIHNVKKKKDQREAFFKNNESSTSVRKTVKSGRFRKVEDII